MRFAKLTLVLILCAPLFGSGMFTKSPSAFGASGPIIGAKCWMGSVVSGTGGNFTASIASAGFAAPPVAIAAQSITVVIPAQGPLAQVVAIVSVSRTSIVGVTLKAGAVTAGIAVYITACGT